LDNDVGHAAVGRDLTQELLEYGQPARRCADADHFDRVLPVGVDPVGGRWAHVEMSQRALRAVRGFNPRTGTIERRAAT
jgi:hypothetical protein